MKNAATLLKTLMFAISIFLLTGCGSSMMTKVPAIDSPGSGHALVTIMRPSVFGGAIKFGTWDEDNFLGILTAKSYIQYEATPGKHLFMARAENWAGVEADLQAGRHYFIIARPMMGAWKARVALDPVNKSEYNEAQINKWLRGLTPIGVIPETVDAYVKPRLDQVRSAATNFKNGSAKTMVLSREDGR
jgi:hypothetical protein